MSEEKKVNGDALEEMAKLDAGSIKLILTDPPYSLPNNQFRPEARINQRRFADFSPYQFWFREFVKEAKRLLTPDGHLVVFCDETFYPVLYPALYENFYATKMLVWDKGRIGMGGIWRRKFELITHSTLQPAKEKSGDADILICPPVREKRHNSEKPKDLLKKIIEKLTNEGDTVLDPFMGSGSTLEAAQELNRESLGFELSPVSFTPSHPHSS